MVRVNANRTATYYGAFVGRGSVELDGPTAATGGKGTGRRVWKRNGFEGGHAKNVSMCKASIRNWMEKQKENHAWRGTSARVVQVELGEQGITLRLNNHMVSSGNSNTNNNGHTPCSTRSHAQHPTTARLIKYENIRMVTWLPPHCLNLPKAQKGQRGSPHTSLLAISSSDHVAESACTTAMGASHRTFATAKQSTRVVTHIWAPGNDVAAQAFYTEVVQRLGKRLGETAACKPETTRKGRTTSRTKAGASVAVGEPCTRHPEQTVPLPHGWTEDSRESHRCSAQPSASIARSRVSTSRSPSTTSNGDSATTSPNVRCAASHFVLMADGNIEEVEMDEMGEEVWTF